MQKADLRRRAAQLVLFAAACWHRPQLARTLGKTALTCDDARTLKFTLIVQGMPMSARPFRTITRCHTFDVAAARNCSASCRTLAGRAASPTSCQDTDRSALAKIY
jgi:hypothetical protein